MRSFICKIEQKRLYDSVRSEGTFFYLTSGVVFAAPVLCPRRGGEEEKKRGKKLGEAKKGSEGRLGPAVRRCCGKTG